MTAAAPRTLYRKLVDAHVVHRFDEQHVLLYADLHVLNEYTSPQAFAGLRAARRGAWRPEAALAVVDHVNPTRSRVRGEVDDPSAALLVRSLVANSAEFGVELFDLKDPRQGIEHVVVPEQGLALPGMVIVCGDSHTTTYGAFGALGFGIGTSEVEHALATQTLVYRPLKDFRIRIDGALGAGVTAKDVVMRVIGSIGVAGANGHAVEFTGSTIDALDMAGRMTVCNMAMEAGARAALMAPDARVLDYVAGRPRSVPPQHRAAAMAHWRTLRTDPGARFDAELALDAREITPSVTWGTSPEHVVSIDGRTPDPADEPDPQRRAALQRALDYMGLRPGTALAGVPVDRVFIGSCTNSRLEDLRSAAGVLRGRRVAPGVRAMVVPGSWEVKRAAESEGIAAVFAAAGAEWRDPGCSMCLAMNDDVLQAGERCASSTNRNFEGRQGRGGRTHLMSPAMAAAAAVTGALTDVRDLVQE